jgi:hypothetical protein
MLGGVVVLAVGGCFRPDDAASPLPRGDSAPSPAAHVRHRPLRDRILIYRKRPCHEVIEGKVPLVSGAPTVSQPKPELWVRQQALEPLTE